MDLLETFTYDTTTHKTFNGFVTTYNYSTATYGTRAEMGEDTFRSAWFYYVAFTCATEVGYDVGDVSRFTKREKGYNGAFERFLDGLLPVLSRAFEEKWVAHSSDACGKEHRCVVGDGHVRKRCMCLSPPRVILLIFIAHLRCFDSNADETS